MAATPAQGHRNKKLKEDEILEDAVTITVTRGKGRQERHEGKVKQGETRLLQALWPPGLGLRLSHSESETLPPSSGP